MRPRPNQLIMATESNSSNGLQAKLLFAMLLAPALIWLVLLLLLPAMSLGRWMTIT